MTLDLLLPGDPTELGGYRLLSRLGSGGMGTVFLGCDPDGRQVAVKIIRPELANEAEFRGRFRSEVNRARSVPAFCTAPVLDADPEHATPYLVVEYVEGPDLAQVLAERGSLAGGELQSVAIGVATALTAIHGAGVIHRDLNPKNVMFSPGTLKVIDFGIARAFEATSNFTRTDQLVGSVSYTAPERFDTGGPAVGPATDIFAWGVLVTVAGTGRGPFGADSPAATAARILTQPPDLGDLPSPLREIVARALAKEPAERPTAAQLLQELLDIGANGPANRLSAPQLRKTARAAQIYASHRPRRRRHLAITVAVAAVLGMSAVWYSQLPMNLGAGDQKRPIAEPAASSSSAFLGDRQLIVRDPLDRAGGIWQAGKDDDGSCSFIGGRMVVVAFKPDGDSCQGYDREVAGDQSIEVTATVVKAHSCGWIGFRRRNNTHGYNLFVCNHWVKISQDIPNDRIDIKSFPTNVFSVGTSHRVELVVKNQMAAVIVDNKPLFDHAAVNDRVLPSGAIQLGVEPDDGQMRNSSAAFQDVEIRKL